MSTLNFLHIIAGDFNAAVFSFLKSREDFVPRVYLDGNDLPMDITTKCDIYVAINALTRLHQQRGVRAERQLKRIQPLI